MTTLPIPTYFAPLIIFAILNNVILIVTSDKGFLWPVIRDCIYGQETDLAVVSDSDKLDKNLPGSQSQNSLVTTGGLLFYCFVGLQASYLTWGYLQEKIMTQKYDEKVFTDSQFLVFLNRIFGLVIASSYLAIYEPRSRSPKAPLYKYSYCAFSNIMSSWFQYEALKFVSFPTQVTA
jgi:adenosine 3'-phospho 5'-phosphosulfate transporter B2